MRSLPSHNPLAFGAIKPGVAAHIKVATAHDAQLPARMPVSKSTSTMSRTTGGRWSKVSSMIADEIGLTGLVSRAPDRPRRNPATVAKA